MFNNQVSMEADLNSSIVQNVDCVKLRNAQFARRFRLAAETGSADDPAVTSELEDLFSFLRFPSVSTDSRNAGDVRDCAGWLIGKLTRMGLSAELHETPKHPVVVA